MRKTIVYVCLLLAAAIVLPSCSASAPDMAADTKASAYNYYPEKPGENFSEKEELSENEFIKTADNAVSTFSADVDTASYTYLRRKLKSTQTLSGLKSGSENIRTEELINYFKYDSKEPENGELFGVGAKLIECPWNNENALLIMGLKTAEAQVKTSNNLVFLIDVSGSMNSEDKLPLLQKSFSYLLSALDEDDTVSIVTYASGEELILDGCPGNQPETIQNAIDSLHASGATNGEAGLKKAYETAEKHYRQNGNNRIILASDGDLNVGIATPEEIEKFVSEKRAAGVYISVFGFGYGNYRDSIMEKIADCGNGVYYYIDAAEEAEKVFCDELLSTLYTVAEDVKLQITFNPETVAEYRLIGYENRMMKTEDFYNDEKDAGEVGAGHAVTVCYELKLNETEDNDKLFDFSVRYKKPGAEQSLQNDYEINYSQAKTERDADTNFIAALCELSMLLHNSKYGENVTLSTVKNIFSAFDYSNDRYKSQLAELIKRVRD